MDEREVWGWIADERRRLADVVGGLTATQWDAPSAFMDWRVRHVGVHLVWPLETPVLALAARFVASGFRMQRVAIAALRRDARGPTEIAGVLRRVAESRFKPPGAPPAVPLAEVMSHSLDIRWPLGIAWPVEPARAAAALDLLVSPKAVGVFAPRGLPDGLRFVASDVGWAHGDGPEVRGESHALLMTLCARSAALDALAGDGVALVRRRIADEEARQPRGQLTA